MIRIVKRDGRDDKRGGGGTVDFFFPKSFETFRVLYSFFLGGSVLSPSMRYFFGQTREKILKIRAIQKEHTLIYQDYTLSINANAN